MLLLTTTSDVLRIVTSAASSIEVHVSYVDLLVSTGAVTPAKQNTIISTATTTTICDAPSSGSVRNIKTVFITNNNTTNVFVEVQNFDGTNATELMGVELLAGENLTFSEEGVWTHYDSRGAEYTFMLNQAGMLAPTGAVAETIPRFMATTNTTAGASGTLFLQSIYLYAGQTVNSISFISATTAASSPTNRLFALYDGNRNLLAQTANDGANAWTANTVKTLSLTAPYKIPTSNLYYIGLLQTATTIATIHGGPAKANAIVASTAPILHGTSSTGLTTTLPNPAAAITAGTASLYAWVS